MDKEFMMELYERCGKEFLMLLYEKIEKELDEMHDSIYEEKYKPKHDPYWEGMCDGINRAWSTVEGVLREAFNGRV